MLLDERSVSDRGTADEAVTAAGSEARIARTISTEVRWRQGDQEYTIRYDCYALPGRDVPPASTHPVWGDFREAGLPKVFGLGPAPGDGRTPASDVDQGRQSVRSGVDPSMDGFVRHAIRSDGRNDMVRVRMKIKSWMNYVV
jgi:hypothetical protein